MNQASLSHARLEFAADAGVTLQLDADGNGSHEHAMSFSAAQLAAR